MTFLFVGVGVVPGPPGRSPPFEVVVGAVMGSGLLARVTSSSAIVMMILLEIESVSSKGEIEPTEVLARQVLAV